MTAFARFAARSAMAAARVDGQIVTLSVPPALIDQGQLPVTFLSVAANASAGDFQLQLRAEGVTGTLPAFARVRGAGAEYEVRVEAVADAGVVAVELATGLTGDAVEGDVVEILPGHWKGTAIVTQRKRKNPGVEGQHSTVVHLAIPVSKAPADLRGWFAATDDGARGRLINIKRAPGLIEADIEG